VKYNKFHGGVVCLHANAPIVCVLQVARSIGQIIRDVIDWVVTYIMERVAGWIMERGGWVCISIL
jgi:hypothetical protein